LIVVGIDPSLTETGVARIADDGPIGAGLNVRTYVTGAQGKEGARLHERSARLRELAHHLYVVSDDADLVVIEGPSLGSTTPHSFDRHGLWWLLVARLSGNGVPVAEVSPSTLKTYALGKGSGKGTGKDAVLAAAVRRYDDHAPELANNNEADALLLADMGARHFGRPLTELGHQHTRALAAIRWPEDARLNRRSERHD
jgi:crossover junction endodeoxyribonuclease RuvC